MTSLAVAHRASELKKLLARQENLLVPGDWTVFFLALIHSVVKQYPSASYF